MYRDSSSCCADPRNGCLTCPLWPSIDGRVVGHVAISMAILRDLQRDTAIANLSPLGVLPSVQRRGIGSALVDEVVARAAERGEPLVVVEGDPAFYGRLGFEYSVPLGIRITLPSWARPECAQVRRLRDTGSSPQGLVVYPPAFDEVDCTAQRPDLPAVRHRSPLAAVIRLRRTREPPVPFARWPPASILSLGEGLAALELEANEGLVTHDPCLMPRLDDVHRASHRVGLASVLVDHVQPATRDGPDMACLAGLGADHGLDALDQLQPGWK